MKPHHICDEAFVILVTVLQFVCLEVIDKQATIYKTVHCELGVHDDNKKQRRMEEDPYS